MNTQLAKDIAKSLCIRWESVILTPYLCPAGVPTIGVGATYYEDGSSVTLNDAPITMERAIQLLEWMIATKYLPAVLRLCPAIDTPERLAAIIDFTFNLGEKNLKISNLRKCINAHDWIAVPTQLMRWNKAAGGVMKGLTARRKAEASLIN